MDSKAIVLRDVHTFFEYHNDPQANYMAAFTANDTHAETAFKEHWQRIMADDQILIQSILYLGDVVAFNQFGEREVSYWLGRALLGKR